MQIKNVPDRVHQVLTRRADAAGQSLQEYLLALLTRETEMPTVEEFVDRMISREGDRPPAGPETGGPSGGRAGKAKRMSSAEVIRELRGPLPDPPTR